MATPLTPVGSKAFARERLVFAPTGSLTAPSLAIAIGVSALDITNIAYADSGTYSVSANKTTSPRRLGQAKTQQGFGTSEEVWGDLRYSVDPQAVAASDGKKAYEKFPEGTAGFFYWRPGVPADTDLAVGQFVIVTPVLLGVRYIDRTSQDEAAEFAVIQQVVVTAPGQGQLVALVA